MQRVQIFDTTLRDGEQAAGCRLGVAEKLRVARQLARLGVDVIEAGFPCSSPADFAAVQEIARSIKGPVICGLSRAVPADIDACGQALAGAEKSRIHTGLGVSDIHIMGKFRADRYGATLADKRATTLAMAVEAVKRARQYTDEVEFFAEDAGRAEPAYLFEVLTAVIAAGATVVNIPDTTGYAVPEQYGRLIAEIGRQVANIDRATISVHCHDDLGMAVANTLAGVANGAGQVEVTINGIGERAGNAALEEVVMALRTRQDFFERATGIDTTELYRTSRLVADALGMTIPPNKAIIGDHAFAHSSGIHVDGFLKERQTYEIMEPATIGFPASRVVLTARTGRHGVLHRLRELGYSPAEPEAEQLYQRFLAVADQKREVSDADLVALLQDAISDHAETYRLVSFTAHCETGSKPRVGVVLARQDEELTATASGDGPVDAAYRAMAACTGFAPRLARYEIQAVTEGTDALGKVTVHMEHDGRQVLGRGTATDIIEASILAYVDGLNRLAEA